MEQKQPTHSDILERGLTIFKKVLEQPVSVTREQMFDLLNFELAVQSTIVNLKSIEGKTREELLEMAQKNLPMEELGR